MIAVRGWPPSAVPGWGLGFRVRGWPPSAVPGWGSSLMAFLIFPRAACSPCGMGGAGAGASPGARSAVGGMYYLGVHSFSLKTQLMELKCAHQYWVVILLISSYMNYDV